MPAQDAGHPARAGKIDRGQQPYGVELALLASVVLAGSSIPRAIKSQKSLPIGLSLLASFGMWTYASAMARGYNKYDKVL